MQGKIYLYIHNLLYALGLRVEPTAIEQKKYAAERVPN